MRAYAYACAHAQSASQRGRVRVRVRATATCHLGITVPMYSIIGTRARMYTGMRALVECISARVGAGARARPRARVASTNCVSLRTFI
jgi:hypothetical protein